MRPRRPITPTRTIAATPADHGSTDGLEALARNAGEVGGSDVSIGIRVRARGDDSAVTVVVVLPGRVHRERRIAFLGGAQGRLRAGLVAAHVLLVELRARDAVPASAASASRCGAARVTRSSAAP